MGTRMKIPKKIKIGGTVYQIREVERIDRSELQGERVVGLWVEEEAAIYLDKNVSPQCEVRTLIHEVTHALFDHCNLEQKEDTVERLSSALHMLFVDNPKLFEP